MSDAAREFRTQTRRYDEVHAVIRIVLTVREGLAYDVIGPRGMDTTTAIHAVATRLNQDTCPQISTVLLR